jgi:hypothetical protein
MLTTTHGSKQQAARLSIASWAAFGIGKRATPPQATSARIAHALFLRLREQLQSLGGDDLIASALAYVPPANSATPTPPSGQYVIEQEHRIAIENDVDRVLIAQSNTAPPARIALAQRLGTDTPGVGETVELELTQPNGVVDIANESDTERLNFYWVIRRGSEQPIAHVEESSNENAHSSIIVGDAVHPEPASSVAAEPQSSDSNALLLTVSEVVGVFRVVTDGAGSPFALHHPGPGLGIGVEVRCIETTKTAEVRLGWKLPVVRQA